MRLEELKDSLTQLADEVPTDNAHGRLAGVDDKIRTRAGAGASPLERLQWPSSLRSPSEHR